MASRETVRIERALVAIGEPALDAKRTDEVLGAGEIGSGHTGEEVVLDLVVQSAEDKGGEPSTGEVSRVTTCCCAKLISGSPTMSGMPLWLGAKLQPR